MSFPEPPHLRRARQRNPNKLELDPMTAIIQILTSSRGWLVRQALKATALVTAPLAVWLEANGHGEHTAAISAGITALVTAGIEMLLSYLARKNP